MTHAFYKAAYMAGIIAAFFGIVAIMPDAEPLPVGIASAFSAVAGYVWFFDFVLPVGTMLTIFQIAVSLTIVHYSYRVLSSVVRVLLRFSAH